MGPLARSPSRWGGFLRAKPALRRTEGDVRGPKPPISVWVWSPSSHPLACTILMKLPDQAHKSIVCPSELPFIPPERSFVPIAVHTIPRDSTAVSAELSSTELQLNPLTTIARV